ncbi:MAG: bifunctional phosphoglucose/phosphomannose isomerase [Bacteroidota bacterium]
MMDQLIARYTEQLHEAIEIGSTVNIRPHDKPINKVYVAGLGGSGIGADFVAAIIRQECKVPYLVGKGYDIPAYVDENTLCIASSYSGNTEETVASFDQMRGRGGKIIIVSSGGKLIDIAKEAGYDHVVVPGNWPSPRACLGYSFVQQLAIMEHLGFISDTALAQVKSSIALLDAEEEAIKVRAQEIAEIFHGRIPVIYCENRMEPVALRLRQQINENAKALCWHNVIPEMNHNELVGWREKNDELAVLYLRNEDDLERNSVRMNINQEIIGKYTSHIINQYSKGANMVERMMYHVHLGDWITWYLCQHREMDSIEVDAIDYLKGELAKL